MPRIMVSIVFLFVGGPAIAGDWPQWLGPNRDCGTQETVAPWKEAPKVVWRQFVEEGHSSPIVAGGKVFLHTKVKDRDEEQVQAWEADTGKIVWTASFHPPRPFTSIFGNGPRATPAFHEGKIYTYSVTGVLRCLDAASGHIDWQVDTIEDFKAPKLFFGAACSPLVEGNRVFIDVGAKGASIVAFDKSTGAVCWKAPIVWKGKTGNDKVVDDRASYSSPILFPKADRRQVVFLTHGGLVSLSPKDGHVNWQYPFVDALSESSGTPVHSGTVLVGSSITVGALALRLEDGKDRSEVQEIWKNPDLNCYFSTPVAVGAEYLYFVSGTKPPAFNIQSTLHCIETQTGKEIWKKSKIGKYHASLLRTGNNKLLLLDDAGELALLDPDPRGYKELARSNICGETWAHPALANGKLFVRDRKELIGMELVP
jgi:outer membrane protein assembly factor BamB